MHRITKALLVGVASLFFVGIASALSLTPWSDPQKIDEIAGNSPELNTTFSDGCPIQSPDGLDLYMASNRDGFTGGTRNLDIWVAHRESTEAPWGAPENAGLPVNSPADDFCPTPVRGHGLFFVSRRSESCGSADSDIYFSRRNPAHEWSEPVHYACTADGGPNTALDEMGPSYFEVDVHGQLYFSSGPDIYAAEQLANGGFGPGQAVAELNSSDNDIQPNVRKDGLEVVFSSNRPGGAGSQDIWTSTRNSTDAQWSAPVNLGAAVNTAASESRPSLSWHAEQLLFGRAPGPEGGTDIYVSTRDKAKGGGK